MNPSTTNNPLSYIETLSQNETDPFRKLHKRKDLGEVLTKIPCIIALVHALRSEKIPSKLKAVLLEKLKAPSIGVWMEVRNEFTNFPTYKKDLGPLFSELEGKKVKTIYSQTMAEIRNKLAHGADNQEETVRVFSGEMEKQILPLLELAFYKNLEFKKEKLTGELSLYSKVYCTVGGTTYDLSPFVYFSEDSVLLFNGYDTDFVPTYVFYSTSATMKREPLLKEEYRNFLPMKDWQENPATFFFVRTPVYSRTHRFRDILTEEVLQWCESGQESLGYLEATAGMGRTSFLSYVIEKISSVEKLSLVELLFETAREQGTLPFFEKYFLERTDEYLTEPLRSEIFPEKFRETLRQMKSEGKTILFLLDAPNRASEEVKKYFQIVLQEGGKILLTKSPSSTEFDSYSEAKKLFVVPPLKDEEFETLWTEILGGRYFKNPTKIEKIKKIALNTAKGNPRVIRLWIGSIRQDRTGLGKRPLEMMPGELQNQYEGFFRDLTERRLNLRVIFGILFLLTGSKTPVSIETMAKILDTTTEDVETQMEHVIDFMVPEGNGYVLSHSTVGEFLKLKYPTPFLYTLKKSGWGFTSERDYIKRNLATF